MLSVLGFLIMLGPLVIVHEFGHYLFARLFGVRAEAFSVGFGPRLWARQIGETEWRLSAIPLGGYVKLLGEDREAEISPEEQARALHRQPRWKRLLIFSGGPLFNFLFAIVVYMAILVIGEPQVASVVGRVVQDSAAEKAGFMSGDRILQVNGQPVRFFEDVVQVIVHNPGQPVRMRVLHPGAGAPSELTITPSVQSGFTMYGENKEVGKIEGLLANPRAAQVGVANPQSSAGKAGLRTGDQILRFNGAELGSWEELEAAYAQAPAGHRFEMTVKRVDSGQELRAMLVKPGVTASATPAQAWGLHSSELFVADTVPGSPAAKAGLRKGDRLAAVGGEPIHSFFGLKEAVQRWGERERKVRLTWEREGSMLSEVLVPTESPGQDPLLNKTTEYTVGVAPMLAFSPPATVIEQVWNPLTLVARSTYRVASFTYRQFVSIGKMFTGEVSVKTLGGPILIGKIAGEQLTRGLIAFLSTMAVLSIGLGVLNILPIPVLDGGHILLLVVEAIRRKPLTLRQMELIQGFGLSLILLLMIVVMKNDLTRLPFFN